MRIRYHKNITEILNSIKIYQTTWEITFLIQMSFPKWSNVPSNASEMIFSIVYILSVISSFLMFNTKKVKCYIKKEKNTERKIFRLLKKLFTTICLRKSVLRFPHIPFYLYANLYAFTMRHFPYIFVNFNDR